MFERDTNTIEFDIKLEIAKIINHFMDFRQDFLLVNLRNEFKKFILD